MALFSLDFDNELNAVKGKLAELIREELKPGINEAITQAGHELSSVVNDASVQIQTNIKIISEEIHNHRSLTKDDITALIDYAANKIGTTIDERVKQTRTEVAALITEKIELVKIELEDSAIRSRKTLYFNVAISVAAAVAMAGVGLIYKKISLGELDIYTLFRVLLLSAATGTLFFSALKALTQWRTLNKAKKNIATVAINYLGIIRPNGALGLFFISVGLIALWATTIHWNQ